MAARLLEDMTHLLTFSYYKTLFQEYFYNPIPSVLFVVLAVVTCIFFRKVNSIKRTNENAQKRKQLRRITLAIWIAALVVLFILCRRPNIRGIRIVDYWYDFGTRHDKIEAYLHGFLADLLIFIPTGYLIRWQRHITHWGTMMLSVSAIAFGIEILQFITMHGCIGVSDLVAYHIGGLLGIYLYRLNAQKFRWLSIFVRRDF